MPDGPASSTGNKPDKPRTFAGECIESGVFGVKCIEPNLALIIGLSIWLGICSLWRRPGSELIPMIIGSAGALIAGACFLTFFVDVSRSSVRGESEPPSLEVSLGRAIVLYLQSLWVFLVFVLPLVTLPLLPLVWLALGLTGDVRTLNLATIGKAAARHAGRLLIVYAVLPAWAFVFLGATFFILTGLWFGRAAVFAFVEPSPLLEAVFLGLNALCIYSSVVVTGGVFFRCAGLLGRYTPGLTESLSNRRFSPGLVAGTAVGLVLSSLVVRTAILGILDPPAWLRPTLQRIQPWVDMQHRRKHEQMLAKARASLEMLGRAFRAYCDSHGQSYPPSLEALARDQGLDADIFADGRYKYGWLIHYLADNPVVIHDTDAGLGVNTAGQVVTCNSDPYLSYLDTQPVEGLWKAPYGQPPMYFRRVRFNEAFNNAAVSLQNFVTDLRAFAEFHSGRYPHSIEELRQEGFLFDAADAQCPSNPDRPVVYVPTPDARAPKPGHILAYNPTPTSRYSQLGVHVLAVTGKGLEVFSFEYLKDRLARSRTPPALHPSTRAIRPDDKPAVRAEQQLRNLGAALRKYSKTHDGNFPRSLEDLLEAGLLEGKAAIRSPSTGRTYVYLAGQKTTSHFTNVLAYDPGVYRVGQYESLKTSVKMAIHVGMDVGFYKVSRRRDDIRDAVKEQSDWRIDGQ